MGPSMTELTNQELAAVKVYRALGDPTRFRLVQMLLKQDELGCGHLQTAFRLSAPALSHHTRVLQECGLLSVRREGPFHFFSIRIEQLRRYTPSLIVSGSKGYK